MDWGRHFIFSHHFGGAATVLLAPGSSVARHPLREEKGTSYNRLPPARICAGRRRQLRFLPRLV